MNTIHICLLTLSAVFIIFVYIMHKHFKTQKELSDGLKLNYIYEKGGKENLPISLQILITCVRFLDSKSTYGVWIAMCSFEDSINSWLKVDFYDSQDNQKVPALLAFDKEFGTYIKYENVSDDYSQFCLHFKKGITEEEINNLYALLKLQGKI